MKQETNINFKSVPNFEDYYATIDGKIYSTKTKKFLKPGTSENGYKYVSLCKKGKTKNMFVHRLVWSAFKGIIPKGLQINHKDENKQNNNLSNLELVTPKENTNFGTRNQRIAEALKKEITLFNENESLYFKSLRDASNKLCINYSTLANLIFTARKKGVKRLRVKKVEYNFEMNSTRLVEHN